MNELIKVDQAITMSSREIAELTGKRHDNVMRVCRELKDLGVSPQIEETQYEHEQNGQMYSEFRLNKRDSLVLVARLSPEFTGRVVDRWLELERQTAINALIPDFTDPEIAARAWADQYAAKRLAEKQLEEARPKVEFHDAVADSVNRQTMQQIAKELNVGPNKLFDFLRKEEVLMDDNLPYQRYIDAGYFRVIMRQYTDPKGEERISSRTFVTGKGAIYIQKLVKGHSELAAGVMRKKVIDDRRNYAN